MHMVSTDWAKREPRGDAINQVRVQVALRQGTGPTGGDADQIADAVLVRGGERIEHGGDEDRSPLVGLDD